MNDGERIFGGTIGLVVKYSISAAIFCDSVRLRRLLFLQILVDRDPI